MSQFGREIVKAGPSPDKERGPAHDHSTVSREAGNYLVNCGSLAVNFDGSFSNAAGQPSQQK